MTVMRPEEGLLSCRRTMVEGIAVSGRRISRPTPPRTPFCPSISMWGYLAPSAETRVLKGVNLCGRLLSPQGEADRRSELNSWKPKINRGPSAIDWIGLSITSTRTVRTAF